MVRIYTSAFSVQSKVSNWKYRLQNRRIRNENAVDRRARPRSRCRAQDARHGGAGGRKTRRRSRSQMNKIQKRPFHPGHGLAEMLAMRRRQKTEQQLPEAGSLHGQHSPPKRMPVRQWPREEDSRRVANLPPPENLIRMRFLRRNLDGVLESGTQATERRGGKQAQPQMGLARHKKETRQKAHGSRSEVVRPWRKSRYPKSRTEPLLRRIRGARGRRQMCHPHSKWIRRRARCRNDAAADSLYQSGPLHLANQRKNWVYPALRTRPWSIHRAGVHPMQQRSRLEEPDGPWPMVAPKRLARNDGPANATRRI